MIFFAPLGLVLAVGVTVLLAARGVALKWLGWGAAVFLVAGFAVAAYGARQAEEAGGPNTASVLGIALIIPALFSGITTTIIALIRAMAQAAGGSK